MSSEVLVLIVVALAFDFMNGLHDAANSIATVVSTGVLKPLVAVGWAAFFNFAALFVFETKVATTVGKGVIDPAIVDHHVVLGALMGAIACNVITWLHAIPSSSSHALIGGLVGAAVARAVTGSLVASGLAKTVAFIVVAPVMRFVLGARRGSACARRQAGLTAGSAASSSFPPVSAAWAMGQRCPEDGGHHLDASDRSRDVGRRNSGAAMGGRLLLRDDRSWHALRRRAPRRDHGAEDRQVEAGRRVLCGNRGAITLFAATHLGILVTTTHTITGAIVGVGSVQTFSAVRWGAASCGLGF